MKLQHAIMIAAMLSAPFVAPACAQSQQELAQPSARKTAQPAAQAQMQVINGKRRYLAQRAESGGTGEGAWQLLKQPMDLPDLPRYTGAGTQFVEGLMYPNKPGGAAITMIYHAKEVPDVVRDWYGDALASYQWKVLPAGKGETITLPVGEGDTDACIRALQDAPAGRARRMVLSGWDIPPETPPENVIGLAQHVRTH